MSKKLFSLVLLLSLISCGSIKNLKKESDFFETEFQQQKFSIEKRDVLNKSVNGNWQLRISGNPYELGYKKGFLTQQLYQNQEKIFFGKVAEMIPNPSKQNKLLYFLKWYNRNILSAIPTDLKQELYALSLFGSDEFNDIGTKFERNLLLHSSHDIGHAMQDLMLVGCSSIALWNNFTEDGNLLIGRNFDFYVNDEFAQNKIVEFISPKNGYKYASVTWPGMVGVVSGMNEKGLTITLNAGKSDIPMRGKTPVSIVARSILQHAETIDEAVEIAEKFEVFVSESFLIGSAKDNKAVVIEMSPKRMDVYETNNGKLICPNHFQSNGYKTDKRNKEYIEESHSYYRLEKLDESFQTEKKYKVIDVLKVLRDISGLQNEDLGLGNEKALNQLMAHHGVIFKPAELKMWVSNNPYQLGAFDAYDLNTIFKSKELKPVKSHELPKDDFLKSKDYKQYKKFRELHKTIEIATNSEKIVSNEILTTYKKSNPELWLVYKQLGDYYYSQKQWQIAAGNYETALQKVISSKDQKKSIEQKLKKTLKKR